MQGIPSAPIEGVMRGSKSAFRPIANTNRGPLIGKEEVSGSSPEVGSSPYLNLRLPPMLSLIIPPSFPSPCHSLQLGQGAPREPEAAIKDDPGVRRVVGDVTIPPATTHNGANEDSDS
jgi:hypothetical protein